MIHNELTNAWPKKTNIPNYKFSFYDIASPLWCDVSNIVTEFWSIHTVYIRILDFLARISSILTHFCVKEAGLKSSRWENVSTAAPINFSNEGIYQLKSHKSLKLSLLKYFAPCDSILNTMLRCWYLSNWKKCVRRRAQVGLLSNRHCCREISPLGRCSTRPLVIQLDSLEASFVPLFCNFGSSNLALASWFCVFISYFIFNSLGRWRSVRGSIRGSIFVWYDMWMLIALYWDLPVNLFVSFDPYCKVQGDKRQKWR